MPNPSKAAWGLAAMCSFILSFVWFLLPTRWAVVDVPSTVAALLGLVTAVGLWRREPWAPTVARWLNLLLLLTGMAVVTTLCFTASYLSGLYGNVGRGGALILAAAALIVVPYLIGVPLLIHTHIPRRRA